MSEAKLLLVEDDASLREALLDTLMLAQYDCIDVASGEEAIIVLKQHQFDLVISDVQMQGIGGLGLLNYLQQHHPKLPVLLMTAYATIGSAVSAIKLGAVDYLAKPFNPRELVARIKAILRRIELLQQEQHDLSPLLELNEVRLNAQNRQVSCAGHPISLTATEFQLLEQLMRRAGEVVTKDDLSRAVLGRRLQQYDRSLDVHISNIRQKLGKREDQQAWIEAVRGKGYQLMQQS